ncbi:MAG: aminoacyl-tRNA hydrolase [Planctomycetes bacterium]|nr:aminoacyl-tRNA hydrolase [Planctomycetota bacterium]
MADLRDLQLSGSRVLPARWLSIRFARSGGPGGQNVNKVSSKADLRLDLAAAAAHFSPEELERIREQLAPRIDAEGQLQVVSSEHREQARNVAAALARMEALLRGALKRPKVRRATKPSRGSKERRLEAKKHRSQVKQWRGRPAD